MANPSTVALTEAELRLRAVLDAVRQPVWIYDETTRRIVDANRAALAEYGWSRAEFLTLHHDDVSDVVDVRDPGTRPTQHRTKDGRRREVRVTEIPVTHEEAPARLVVVEVLAPDERTRAILDSAADAILSVDNEGRIETVNPATERMFGRSAGELVGTDVTRLMDALDRETTGHCADGKTFPLELSVNEAVIGERTVYTVIARDVTERKAFERRLTHQGTHDPLTGLPNRVLFMDRVAHALATAGRTRRPVAVLFCDLDRFKVVNDSLGHNAGDALLYAVAQRFRGALRTSDTVARFGGDEFVILTEELTDAADASVVAQKLAASLEEPIKVGGKEIHVTSSMGIAVADLDADTPDSLVRDADVAMYRAKANGRSRAEQFDTELREQAIKRLDTESALRRGMGLREFVVHYQPEFELETERLVGVEALVRWDHPDNGLTAPSHFLPIAEETGLIVSIGESVLQQAAVQIQQWGDRAPMVWVNVSARQLAAPELVDIVRDTVTGLSSPSLLGLEITETDIVPDDAVSKTVMTALTDLGVRVAIDDFGTGFASLSYLWRFPADVVKIDRSFVKKLDDERDAVVLVAAMIQLAHNLGKTTVAEGVETEEQLRWLRELGCDVVQGYLLGRPAPEREVEHLLV